MQLSEDTMLRYMSCDLVCTLMNVLLVLFLLIQNISSTPLILYPGHWALGIRDLKRPRRIVCTYERYPSLTKPRCFPVAVTATSLCKF